MFGVSLVLLKSTDKKTQVNTLITKNSFVVLYWNAWASCAWDIASTCGAAVVVPTARWRVLPKPC